MGERHTYGAKEVCQIVDISLRQLGYWKLIGVVKPRKELRENKVFFRYSEKDLQVLKAIRQLTGEGYLVSKAAERVKAILDSAGNDPEALLRALQMPRQASVAINYFQMRLQEEIKRARRFGESLSCLGIRLTGLDPRAEDTVVRQVQDLLNHMARRYDVFAQLEGAEFLFLLPNTDGVGATRAKKRIARSLGENDFTSNGSRVNFDFVIAAVSCDARSEDSPALIERVREELSQVGG